MTRRPTVHDLRRELEEIDPRPDESDVLGVAEALKYLGHVREERAEADDPAEYFGRPVAWHPELAPDSEEAYPDLLEDDNYRTPTPPDVYALRYCGDITASAVLQRLFVPDDEEADR